MTRPPGSRSGSKSALLRAWPLPGRASGAKFFNFRHFRTQLRNCGSGFQPRLSGLEAPPTDTLLKIIMVLYRQYFLPISLLGILIVAGCGQQTFCRDIRADGRFDDWSGIAPTYTDQTGDGDGIDIGRVWLNNDDKRFFLRFELGEEISIQSGNSLVLYLDTDDDFSTGLPVNGIGADLYWSFGDRSGSLYTGGNNIPVHAYDLGLVTSPTVTSSEFEVEFVAPPGKSIRSTLFPGKKVRWILRDKGSSSGDLAPDEGETAAYLLKENQAPPYKNIILEREDPESIRIATYNALWDNLFKEKEALSRVLKIIRPDIITFQEVAVTSENQVSRILTDILEGEWWTARKKDVITASRYPIKKSGAIDGNLATLLDLPAEIFPRGLLVINVHLPFGGHEAARRKEAENIIKFIGGVKQDNEKAIISPNTPIVIIGDFNLVGESGQLDILLNGIDSGPDWDGTSLADLFPYHSSAPEFYTWQSSHREGFGPGRLDLVIYTDSLISPIKSYILCTETMEDSELSRYGLKRNDSPTISDHYPTVVDFVFDPSAD
jgi:exonuclease III